MVRRSTTAWRLAPLLALALLAGAPGQQKPDHHPAPPAPDAVPATLKLAGDPSATLELGLTRAPPAPARRADGRVVAMSYACRTCLAANVQEPLGATPKPPSRVLGQEWGAAALWIEHLSPGVKAFAMHLKRATLVCAFEDGPVDDVTPDEIARLKVFFPDVPAAPKELGAHQLAHLWAERLVRLESALEDVLDLDEDGRMRRDSGAYAPVPYDRCEIYAFSSEKAWRGFVEYLYEADAWAPGGGYVQNTPTGAVVVGGENAPAIRRRFAFTATLQHLNALSKLGGALPAWMKLGLSHYMEHRAAPLKNDADSATLPKDPTLAENQKAPPDRAQFVRDMVVGGKAGNPLAMAISTESGLSTRSRIQSWSMTRYLIGVDRAKFAALWRMLLNKSPSEAREKALLDSLRAVYATDLVTFDNAWRVWAMKA